VCLRLQLFIAGEGDRFIAPTHSKLIFERYSGDKNLVRADRGCGELGAAARLRQSGVHAPIGANSATNALTLRF
jgi:hypothetical protein